MNEEIIKSVISDLKCGRCGQHCEPADIDVIGSQEDLCFLSVYCPSCQSQGLVVASIEEKNMPAVVTEPTEMEKSEFSMPVSLDDVIDMHVFLEDFSGDFSSVFAER